MLNTKFSWQFGDINVDKIKYFFCTYSPVITTSGDWTQILAILFFEFDNSEFLLLATLFIYDLFVDQMLSNLEFCAEKSADNAPVKPQFTGFISAR